ncbi:MAG: type II toxin-antitoxin system VapC family toxin [Deltaproteobacteria bacterium]|nr:type II toxin-antitoxin system VapC family toxin [Deltaproteobacteria bacterium]
MILYLDSSSLVKLYVEETHSEQVRRWVDEATVVSTSVVAYPEAAAAFARKAREGGIEPESLAPIVAALEGDWSEYAVIGVSERPAGGLAVKHGLRGFDAIHLAAALELATETTGAPIAFSSFDARLNRAAVSEGLAVLEPLAVQKI